MKPYYQDLHDTLFNMNFMDNDLPDESVQMVVTSPPYWGLRKYSGEQELVWGDSECDHEWGSTAKENRHDHTWATSSPIANRPETRYEEVNKGQYCQLCGAWKGGYGLEPDPSMYVKHTIEILREIRRVLRKDGVVFWNIGDSYSGSGQGGGGGSFQDDKAEIGVQRRKAAHNLKPKDLCLIPFRIAIAAQADGWWIRSDIIWSKPNPMPESVTDRPTNSHEHILMLTKSAKYYWDAEAVRMPNLPQSIERAKHAWKQHKTNDMVAIHNVDTDRMGERFVPEAGRNIRSVWEFPTQSYPEAHFAVFPEKLPELCIKAATPEVGCCSKCGAPWERIVERTGHINKREPAHAPKSEPTKTDSTGWAPLTKATNKWQPTCKCNADKVPSTILDPFAGAGTSLWVAKKLNRKAIGFELSEEYCQLIVERIRQQVMM